MADKRYLGDGVYVERDDRGLVLTAENGIRASDTIVLEPEVYEALTVYVGGVVDREGMDGILDAMDAYGGSFVKHLAELYRLADADNQRRILRAFGPYFEKYREVARVKP